MIKSRVLVLSLHTPGGGKRVALNDKQLDRWFLLVKGRKEAGVLPLAGFLTVLHMWSETRSRLFEFLAHGWVSIKEVLICVPFVLGQLVADFDWWFITTLYCYYQQY